MQNQKSALGLDGNITALIGYVVGIVALVLIFIEKDNKFVRFHAIQSVIYHIGAFAIIISVWIIGGILAFALSQISQVLGLVGIVVYLFGLLLWFGWLAGMIYAAIKSYQGSMFKFPIVGNMAEKWSN
jgi:uncharacterized membrane protein